MRMRTLSAVLTLALAMAVGPNLWADDKANQDRGEKVIVVVERIHDLNLTDEQEAKIADIRKEYQPKVQEAAKDLVTLVKEEVEKAREEGLKAGKRRREVIASLNLTNEQKEKVEAVAKEMATLVREEMEKIRDVLTEGQKEKLQEFQAERRERVRDRRAHRIANHRDLNLTDEQKSQIAEVRKEYRPKVHEAGNKLRPTIREEVEAILAVLKR